MLEAALVSTQLPAKAGKARVRRFFDMTPLWSGILPNSFHFFWPPTWVNCCLRLLNYRQRYFISQSIRQCKWLMKQCKNLSLQRTVETHLPCLYSGWITVGHWIMAESANWAIVRWISKNGSSSKCTSLATWFVAQRGVQVKGCHQSV